MKILMLDYASIIEGSRRLRNYFQEKGYFFATVTPYCGVKPEFTGDEAAVFCMHAEQGMRFMQAGIEQRIDSGIGHGNRGRRSGASPSVCGALL